MNHEREEWSPGPDEGAVPPAVPNEADARRPKRAPPRKRPCSRT